MPQTASTLMKCFEVWGGNQAVDSAVGMSGLDAWVYSRPFGDATGGGDVYYVSACATGRITRLLVADVAGHGNAVQELAVGLRGLMRRYVNYLDQTRFVQAMNEQFTALSRNGIFATAVVTTFFSVNNHLSLCNAGHPPPLVYRAARHRWAYLRGETEEAEASGDLPLGIEDRFSYTEFEVPLALGDMVLCYTDSLTEARFENGDLLGLDGLLRIVQSLNAENPAGLIPALIAAVAQTTRDEGLARDDMTALLFRVNSQGTKPTLGRWLMAPALFLRELFAALRPGGGPIPWPDPALPNLGGASAQPAASRSSRTPTR